jgi:phage shock protein PspC (stress-responsive transcriptional regulator)
MTENPTQSVPPPSTSFLDDSFARLRSSGYARDTDGRWFGGVCTGLAQRFGVDPVLIRAAAVVLAFLGGIGLTAYVILWLLLPDRQGDILAERAVRQGDAGPIALLVLAAFLVLGGVFSIGNGNGWFAPLWLIPVAAIAWLVLARRSGRTPQTGYGSVTAPPPPYGTPSPAPYGTPTTATPPPSGEAMSATPSYAAPPMASTPTQTPTAPYAGSQPGAYRGPQPGTYGGPAAGGPSGPYGGRPTPPAPPRAVGPVGPPPPPRPRRRRPSAFVGLVSLGIALVGIGLGAALDDPLGFPGSSATLGFIIALTGVSVVVLTLGLRGRASGFSGFLVVMLALLLVAASAASRVQVQDGVGERTWTPLPATGVTAFELGAGEATLDLRQLDSATAPTAGPQRITVEMGAGDLTILVPNGLDTRVDASVGFGDITHTGGIGGATDTSGSDRSTSTVIGDQPVQVVVDAQLGLGQITIQEQ